MLLGGHAYEELKKTVVLGPTNTEDVWRYQEAPTESLQSTVLSRCWTLLFESSSAATRWECQKLHPQAQTSGEGVWLRCVSKWCPKRSADRMTAGQGDSVSFIRNWKAHVSHGVLGSTGERASSKTSEAGAWYRQKREQCECRQQQEDTLQCINDEKDWWLMNKGMKTKQLNVGIAEQSILQRSVSTRTTCANPVMKTITHKQIVRRRQKQGRSSMLTPWTMGHMTWVATQIITRTKGHLNTVSTWELKARLLP